MKNKKGFLQISFGWLFAIIVGAAILGLAIFGVTKLIKTEETVQDAKVGKEIGILLNPLETSFETITSSSFILPVETRIYNKCDNSTGLFGRQLIQVSQRSFNKWTETDIRSSFPNKYIFSTSFVEGKRFYLFAKPLEFPFKVADLIYLTSSEKEYCFAGAPEKIKKDISGLKQENLLTEDCSETSIKICFGSGSNCDIEVSQSEEYVKKAGKKVFFETDSLMYAAIFADREVYECQLKRLMLRVENLALLYNDKANFVSQVGCDSNLDLIGLNNGAKAFTKSSGLNTLNYIVEDLKEKNKDANCKLW